jgi:hypothetical protein
MNTTSPILTSIVAEDFVNAKSLIDATINKFVLEYVEAKKVQIVAEKFNNGVIDYKKFLVPRLTKSQLKESIQGIGEIPTYASVSPKVYESFAVPEKVHPFHAAALNFGFNQKGPGQVRAGITTMKYEHPATNATLNLYHHHDLDKHSFQHKFGANSMSGSGEIQLKNRLKTFHNENLPDIFHDMQTRTD